MPKISKKLKMQSAGFSVIWFFGQGLQRGLPIDFNLKLKNELFPFFKMAII